MSSSRTFSAPVRCAPKPDIALVSPRCVASRKYCGGTWKGIESRLDYIQHMGFDAVWISPIVANIEGETYYGEAYPGYWPVDQNALNGHFGTASDLTSLSSALHSRGMYLMLDLTINHLAGTSPPPTLNYSSFTPFSSSSDFHRFCWITEESNQTDVEQCWLGDAHLPLADVDTEDAGIVDFFGAWVGGLVRTYGADGVRIGTVRNVRKTFWPGFAKASGVFTIGEVLDGDVQYVSAYTQVLDSVLDYPTFYPLVKAFNSTNSDLTELANTYQAVQDSYKYGAFSSGTFLENQDSPRFQSYTTDEALVKNAITWPFVGDGVPILYYGQEQGFKGGNNPDNHEALWLSDYNENSSLVMHVKALNAARKAAMAANESIFLTTPVAILDAEKTRMMTWKPPMLGLFTNNGSDTSPKWEVPETYAPGLELIDVLSCNNYIADSNGRFTVNGQNGMPQVILPMDKAFNKSYCEELKKPVRSSGSSTSSSPGAEHSSGPTSAASSRQSSVLALILVGMTVLLSLGMY
ncbi:glycoside hydrolase family 13 protein [Laetiporus sulphureus 93-53]|uniref:alpha-amylase n=1 Tax=Laetiporus sulphureus 93-53 TaxID=1314785 RepID=A0A165DLH8_9APHY|nr:glycoside hydrolase family 13 protein [Laetiporus sulphureus 93-53]KZT05147.1 glycoside hydrolase family 13 protein [Laetiporus sulphureus 93-53]